MEINEDKLDESWINDFDKIDNLYSDYYKNDVYFVKITCLYVDSENSLFKIKEEKFFMQNTNILSREELIAVIKKNSHLNDKRFSLLSLLKYNINIEPQDIKYFLISENLGFDNDNKYITVLKNLDEIEFDKTITMYHDLNDIIIIYYENNLGLYKNKNSQGNNNKNNTKKIYLHNKNNHKKTIRK